MEYIFCGWNINIDAVIQLQNQQTFDILAKVLQEHNQGVLDQFLQAFTIGESHEFLVEPQIIKILMKELDTELLLAGQGGYSLINIINSFPNIKPVLHLPNRCPRLVQMLQNLSPRILVFDNDGLQSIGQIQFDSNELPPIHIVIEYDSNFTLTYNTTTYKSARNNRFIITFDETNCYLKLDKQFINSFKSIIDKNWGVFLSGYQLISKNVLTQAFMEQHTQVLNELKKIAKWVHLELAFTDCIETQQFINEQLLPIVSSVGLNETEIKMQAQSLNIQYKDEYQVIHDFFKQIDTKIMLYHNLGFYYALEKYNSGLNFQKGFKTAENVVLSSRSCKDSKQFYKKPSFINQLDPKYFYTPACINPISYSVGLGDTVSSSIFVGMLQ
ncbi:ADP-dependent glucokinase / ADP-specific phosphofructokinase [Spironucleus salmonicida]|uniref:ADP-specific phosphofructokinase n=1 Tax=Spironucleus salmonicida TaxID=348837 RepID=V6LR97_9EUKA|nr:ADP-dependent glucokinase / ADP-specific phosphofructokinase [Spironucleus salmonicida]|eukprot:EST46211.1 ADP-specific phosphofructokinase [Spironucleus salmonicida]